MRRVVGLVVGLVVNGFDWFSPKRTVPVREGSVHSEEDDFLHSEEVTGLSLG